MRFSFVVMFWSFNNIVGWQKTEYHSRSLHRVCMNGLLRGYNFAYWAVDTHIKAIFSLHCSELIDYMYTTVGSILRLVFITHGDIYAPADWTVVLITVLSNGGSVEPAQMPRPSRVFAAHKQQVLMWTKTWITILTPEPAGYVSIDL